MSSENEPKFSIEPLSNGPFLVKGLENFANKAGSIEIKATMALCRCGHSANKPFCDGQHAKVGFSSAQSEDRVEDRRDSYEGAEITIHDNRGICVHCGHCTDELPSVFRFGETPWIHPNAASKDEIVAMVRTCPSGSLSYTVDGVDQADPERAPTIFAVENGPYVVTGAPELVDTSFGDGASTEHFALCGCGGSKNKPFCDGTHRQKAVPGGPSGT